MTLDPGHPAVRKLLEAIQELCKTELKANGSAPPAVKSGADPPLMLTVKQAAQQLAITESLVYALINARILPSIRFSERCTRIPRDKLEVWVRATVELSPAERDLRNLKRLRREGRAP